MNRKADAAAIRQAFMNKAKICHPDVNDSPQVGARCCICVGRVFSAPAVSPGLRLTLIEFVANNRPRRTFGKFQRHTSGA